MNVQGSPLFEDAIKERLVQGARMFAAMVTGPTQCIPGASQAVDLATWTRPSDEVETKILVLTSCFTHP